MPESATPLSFPVSPHVNYAGYTYETVPPACTVADRESPPIGTALGCADSPEPSLPYPDESSMWYPAPNFPLQRSRPPSPEELNRLYTEMVGNMPTPQRRRYPVSTNPVSYEGSLSYASPLYTGDELVQGMRASTSNEVNDIPASPTYVNVSEPAELEEEEEEEEEADEEEGDDDSARSPLVRCRASVRLAWTTILAHYSNLPENTWMLVRPDNRMRLVIYPPDATMVARSFVEPLSPWPNRGVAFHSECDLDESIRRNEFMVPRDIARDVFLGEVTPAVLWGLISTYFGGLQGRESCPPSFDWRAALRRSRRGNQKIGAPKNKLP